MTKIEASVVIDRPVEDVWKFITEISKFPKWNPGVLEPKQTSAGPLGVGATGEFKLKMGNATVTILVRVTEYEQNRKFSFEHILGPLKGTTECFYMKSIEGKTGYTHLSKLVVGPLVTPSMRKGVVTILGNAKRILESEAKS
jgi:uncharacterized protein YndB with AHSA1/START domain